MRALARSVTDRYPDAREFQNDLLEFLHPATPDLTRVSFAHFLGDVFADEMREEHQRLEEGTRRATLISEQSAETGVDPAWAETAGGTLRTRASRQFVLLLVGVMLLLLGGLAWVVFKPAPAPAPPAPPPLTVLDGTASVELDVPARVSVDGTFAGEGTQVEMPSLAPGTHALHVEAPGYAPRDTSFTIAAGDRLRLSERMVPLPAATLDGASASTDATADPALPVKVKATEPGHLAVNVSRNWAHVWIDGQKLDLTTPLAKVPLAPGVHTVRVENADFGIDATRQVTVQSGGAATVLFDLE
jgi:hypothetical protein